ncbi:MAG: hypothetical protein D8M54_06000 [Chloroflexi bacterium]|nr:hypothetical protein [Chloroflexota bacterium]
MLQNGQVTAEVGGGEKGNGRVGETICDHNFCFHPVAVLGRELQACHLALRIAVSIQPQFACTAHLADLLRNVQRRAGQQLPLAERLVLQLVAQVDGKGGGVNVVGEVGGLEIGRPVLSFVEGLHVLGGDEEAEEVALGGEGIQDVGQLFPGAIFAADAGTAVTHFHFGAAGSVQDITAVGPKRQVQGLGRQVGRALQV